MGGIGGSAAFRRDFKNSHDLDYMVFCDSVCWLRLHGLEDDQSALQYCWTISCYLLLVLLYFRDVYGSVRYEHIHLLQCFIADEDFFDGDECYAEGELGNWLDGFEVEEKRIVGRN